MKREYKEIKGARVIYPVNKGDGSIFLAMSLQKNRTVPFILAGLVIALFFLFINCADAEVATLQKSLIWSADNSSEYSLSRNSAGIYSPDNFIATSGQITGITVNWQGTGKINFEVSADSGLNYTQVTNGVPLKSGFISGNRLRWRATALSDDAKLILVNINYTDTQGVRGNFGEPTLSGFLYRKEIPIKNSTSQDLFNYQLKLKIGENETVKNTDANLSGHTLADFKDIRFSAQDGQTPLAYYAETLEGKAGSRVATIWVKVPQIPAAGVSIYLYYGNDEAKDLSDPSATFDFYEDFKAGSLDKNKWVVHTDPKGNAELANGMLKLDAAEIITKDFQFKEGIVEYSSSAETGFESSLNVRNKNDDSYDSPVWLVYSSIYKGAEHCIAVNGIVKANDASAKLAAAGQNYNCRVSLDNGKLAFERFDQTNTEKQGGVTYDINPAPKVGYLSLRSGGDGAGKNVIYFGTIRARKTASVLPAAYNIGKEEGVALPVFVDTTVTGAGNLALKDDAKSGYYSSAVIPAAMESVRIIIPSWKAASLDATTVNAGISADSGLTYKRNCEEAKYYYASKKDFSAGRELKARFDLSRGSLSQKSAGITEFSLDYRPGKITIISPSSGDEWAAGTEKQITWSASDYEPSYPFNIEYSSDAGKNYTIIAEKAANSGEYLWKVDASAEEIVIKISDANDPSIFDLSDKNLVLTAAAELNGYLGSGEGKWGKSSAWAAGKPPDLKTEATIATNATIYADEPVAFRSLTIGDGVGNTLATVVLKKGINKSSGEIIIRKGGRLIQDCREALVISGNLSIKSGGIFTHAEKGALDITAKNINLEPGSLVDATAKNNYEGGLIKMSTAGDFNIFGKISASGDNKKGAKGGSIYLTAGKFGGKGALIYAEGGLSGADVSNGGKFVVKGKGAISGVISVNPGGNKNER